MWDTEHKPLRREFLGVGLTGAMVGLAGCSALPDGTDETNGSDSNGTDEVDTSETTLPVPATAKKVELTAEQREALRNDYERGGELNVEQMTGLSVYETDQSRDLQDIGVWFQDHKSVGEWEQVGQSGGGFVYRSGDEVVWVGWFESNRFDDSDEEVRIYLPVIRGPWPELFNNATDENE